MKVLYNPPVSEWQKLCQRPLLQQQDLIGTVEAIYAAVMKEDDAALMAYTKRFDGVDIAQVVVSPEQITHQASKVPAELKQAIDDAYNNINAFHLIQRREVRDETLEVVPGVVCWRESRAIERVGLYIPGGTAPLVSTVLMLGVPAQIAGCKEVILCTPPNRHAMIEPAICYAAIKIGATKVISVGGAQAVAALTFGTKSVPKVDKIFGPGNHYVTAAKQLAIKYGVAIDMPAGPSEVLVIADESANPAYVASDLLSQAEHGPDSQVVLVAMTKLIAEAVDSELKQQISALARKSIVEQALANSFGIVLETLDEAIAFANTYAPEHLILSVKTPEKCAKKVVNAGSVFLGNYSPESAGDYASGTNHTLPTNGWARSYGGVSLDSFVKKITFQSITKAGLEQLGPTIVTLAKAESLTAHANAVTIRIKNKL